MPLVQLAEEQRQRVLSSIKNSNLSFDNIIVEHPILNVNTLCDLIEDALLHRELKKYHVFGCLGCLSYDVDAGSPFLLSEEDYIYEKFYGIPTSRDEIYLGGASEAPRNDFEKQRLLNLYKAVRVYLDDIFTTIFEIEKILHFKIFCILIDNFSGEWFLKLNGDRRKEWASRAEDNRGPIKYPEEKDSEITEDGFDEPDIAPRPRNLPGFEEIRLFGYSSLIDLKEIIHKQWGIFAVRLPKVYADKTNALRVFDHLNRLRNRVAHPIHVNLDNEGYSMRAHWPFFEAIEGKRTCEWLETTRENFDLARWR